MKNEKSKDFLKDLVFEFLLMTKDEELYRENDVFLAGYRAALYSVAHLFEEQCKSWEMDSKELGCGNFSADVWRIEGLNYWSKGG